MARKNNLKKRKSKNSFYANREIELEKKRIEKRKLQESKPKIARETDRFDIDPNLDPALKEKIISVTNRKSRRRMINEIRRLQSKGVVIRAPKNKASQSSKSTKPSDSSEESMEVAEQD
mmetsp:Transcript_12251/g.22748  ORF Transcript_12251/g.22748 Transcript_12251/m.22748 type:complete len:119 (-) Transcript_12251:1054-1410(-)|eukprot:CAMPEP_0184548692 /NCGR_PEP_ID=MMETSP0199_2-20130426/6357_1 /TAXON_ID=1112570 /ORGANISM="Thraustochytrium sp., Strain LLF1b" /LENGTH=118 /DNA_ID=CAMNT_0026943325 /DNA_START=124 /DNA_END=480 /DNA_ORIENTATION=-